ncbi:hypothetical protein [Aromatoleum diolicum]|uniref:Uncharacterized protein n=1 Tax=Aromatoleum diolicum TaxID=75796 RepID=A0ABX1QC25_9RHOO|nr:hypothetical protein [Aromatoleum diolicum]NMG75952.1 hypothetical protein [Aromatoleum diolicum]
MNESSLRNLFEVNNARTQSIEEVVRTFVPSDSFWRLVNGKNHVVLGARGSGKTAVLKMLAHDHFSRFDDPTISALVAGRKFIGTFVPMRADWIGTLKNKPWYSLDDSLRSFQWRLNLSCCAGFISTVESCLRSYCPTQERIFKERDIADMLRQSWVPNGRAVDNLRGLRTVLEDVEWEAQVNALSATTPIRCGPEKPTGGVFDSELFGPINRGIQILKRVIDFPDDAIWALALDELEFLDESHHELINTFLRGKSTLAFKLSTMPYFHHTLRTRTSQPITAGNDFDYVYLDNDPSIRRTDRRGWTDWANDVLSRKVAFVEESRAEEFSLTKLLGNESPLFDEKPSSWQQDSSMMLLLKKFGNRATIERAQRLSPKAFKDQISRKMHGMLLLRDYADRSGGHKKHQLYSGPKLFALCSDANPRQLIRLFNELTLRRGADNVLDAKRLVNQTIQSQCAISFSGDILQNAATEEGIGGELHAFIKNLMEYFHSRFYDQQLTTDYYYAIKTPNDVTDELWELIRHAVGLGLMFPKASFTQPDSLPERGSSEFDMAFRLAPKYGLLPRKGKPVPLLAALKKGKMAPELHCSYQMDLL